MSTTIIVSEILDALCDAVDAAREAAKGDARWERAIDAAYDYLLTVDTVEYDHERHEVTMPSASEPGVIRKANGVCSCKAFQNGNACFHRACARILRRAIEAMEAAPVAAPAFQRGQRVRVLATGLIAIVTEVFADRRGPGVAATASNGAIITVYSPHELEAAPLAPVAERMTAARAALLECFS